MKKEVFYYGISLALLILLLNWIEYSYLIHNFREEWYVGALAVIFTGFGLWAGIKLRQKQNSDKPYKAESRPQVEVPRELEISRREMEVLLGIEEGLSNKQIAEKLFLSENTIKTHTSNLFSKLNVQRRTQAIQEARRQGLIR